MCVCACVRARRAHGCARACVCACVCVCARGRVCLCVCVQAANLELAGEAEVADLDLVAGAEEDVAQLEVAMDNLAVRRRWVSTSSQHGIHPDTCSGHADPLRITTDCRMERAAGTPSDEVKRRGEVPDWRACA